MKYSLSLLLMLFIFSCNAQEKEIDITGNWYLEATNSGKALCHT
ncbi:hypothetical protein [Lacinutrix sp. Bg11-31]|nr:hypothetical protein [Lacinutrix sp. Bg11-31]